MKTFSATSFEDWRVAARSAYHQGLHPEETSWHDGRDAQASLFDDEPLIEEPNKESVKRLRINQDFLLLLKKLAAVSHPERWDFLYRLLWRVAHESTEILEDPLDPDAAIVRGWLKELHRDSHKMKAFLRFRKRGENFYTARYEPQHYVLENLQDFFCGRFASMDFEIKTPHEKLSWISGKKSYARHKEPWQGIEDDSLDELWLTYYKNTYNPARMNMKATLAEMPKKLWKNMPETKLIPELLEGSEAAVQKMLDEAPAAPSFDPGKVERLEELPSLLEVCRGCELSHGFGSTVAGVGPATASIVIVGEQPGDQEEKAGTPFIGPAGQLLDQALQEIGLNRNELYLTNAVKHFRHQRSASGRIHKRPAQSSVHACRPFLLTELRLVRPKVVICLGLTALRSFFGGLARLDQPVTSLDISGTSINFIASCHPAAVLRAEQPKAQQLFEQLSQALRQAKDLVLSC